MLSAFPATLSADSFLGSPFPSFGPGFPPWEIHDPPFLFHTQDEPPILSLPFSQEPVSSNSGSDIQNQTPTSGSGDSNCNEPKTLSSDSGSDYENRDKFKVKRCDCNAKRAVDERKHRRMLSNRESARRSRMRKQKHLENLRNQANRLKVGNREQENRLRLIVNQTQLFRHENECLRTEAAVLRQRLWDMRQVLVVRQFQQILNPMQMQTNHRTI